MKCKKCKGETRIATEQVGIDGNGIPIYHRFAYCDSCMTKFDIDVRINEGEFQIEKPQKETENIELICKPSVDAYFFPIGIGIISAMSLYKFFLLSLVIIIVCLVWGISIKSRKISISNFSINAQMGIINQVKLNTPLSAVSSVTVTSGIFARSSNYGTIKITCAEGVFVFKDMNNADEFGKVFNKLRGSQDWR